MKLNKEAIIKVLKENSSSMAHKDAGTLCLKMYNYENVARQILELMQPNIDPVPQLNKHDVSRRTLKVWNGRGHGKHSKNHINVAAYTKKQAAELISLACESNVSISEITVYYSDCWGNKMDGIIPTEPCVYIHDNYGASNPIRVL